MKKRREKTEYDHTKQRFVRLFAKKLKRGILGKKVAEDVAREIADTYSVVVTESLMRTGKTVLPNMGVLTLGLKSVRSAAHKAKAETLEGGKKWKVTKVVSRWGRGFVEDLEQVVDSDTWKSPLTLPAKNADDSCDKKKDDPSMLEVKIGQFLQNLLAENEGCLNEDEVQQQGFSEEPVNGGYQQGFASDKW